MTVFYSVEVFTSEDRAGRLTTSTTDEIKGVRVLILNTRRVGNHMHVNHGSVDEVIHNTLNRVAETFISLGIGKIEEQPSVPKSSVSVLKSGVIKSFQDIL